MTTLRVSNGAIRLATNRTAGERRFTFSPKPKPSLWATRTAVSACSAVPAVVERASEVTPHLLPPISNPRMAIMGVMAGITAATTKRRFALRTERAEIRTPLRGRTGSIIQQIRRVYSSFCTLKAGAIARSRASDVRAISRETTSSVNVLTDNTSEYRRSAATQPEACSSRTRIGISDVSRGAARTSAANEGTRNAIRNASIASLVPNSRALMTIFSAPKHFVNAVLRPVATVCANMRCDCRTSSLCVPIVFQNSIRYSRLVSMPQFALPEKVSG